MATTNDLDAELDHMARLELQRDARPQMPVAPGLVRESFPKDERNLAIGVHLGTLGTTIMTGGLFLPLLVPLLAHIVLKDRSEHLSHHVRQQLNFQITLALVAIVSVIGSVVTFGVGLLVAIPLILFFLGVELVASIKGAMAASRGEEYEFPFTFDFVK
jgi:uncharacterized protein